MNHDEQCRVVSIVNHRLIKTELFNGNQNHRPVGDILVQYHVAWATVDTDELRPFSAPSSWINDQTARAHFPRLVMLYWAERVKADFAADGDVTFSGVTFTLPVDEATFNSDRVKLWPDSRIYAKRKMTRNDLRVRFRAIFIELEHNGRCRPLESVWQQLERIKKEDEVNSMFDVNHVNKGRVERYTNQLIQVMAADNFQIALQTVADNISCYQYLKHDLTRDGSGYTLTTREIRRLLDAHDAELKQWHTYPEKPWTPMHSNDFDLKVDNIRHQANQIDWTIASVGVEKSLFKRKKRHRSRGRKGHKRPNINPIPAPVESPQSPIAEEPSAPLDDSREIEEQLSNIDISNKERDDNLDNSNTEPIRAKCRTPTQHVIQQNPDSSQQVPKNMETDMRELDPDIEYTDNDPDLLVPEFIKHANYTIFFDSKCPDFDKTMKQLQSMLLVSKFWT